MAAPAKRPRRGIEEDIARLASSVTEHEFDAARDDVEEYFKASLRRAFALVVEKAQTTTEEKVVEIEKIVENEKIVYIETVVEKVVEKVVEVEKIIVVVKIVYIELPPCTTRICCPYQWRARRSRRSRHQVLLEAQGNVEEEVGQAAARSQA